jgi:hypothetical protein
VSFSPKSLQHQTFRSYIIAAVQLQTTANKTEYETDRIYYDAIVLPMGPGRAQSVRPVSRQRQNKRSVMDGAAVLTVC